MTNAPLHFDFRRHCGSADCRRPHSPGAERKDQLRVVEKAPAPDQEAHPPLTGRFGKVLQCRFKYVSVPFSCIFKHQSAAISADDAMMRPCFNTCANEIPTALIIISLLLLLSDRSPQANLNPSTSSITGVHRSTEDLRSWQSSSLGRLRESHRPI